MKKIVLLTTVALLAMACSPSSDQKVVEKGTPDPNAADGVSAPDDAVVRVCNVDSDCDTAGLAICQETFCANGQCVVQSVVTGTACDGEGLGECQRGECHSSDAGSACVAVPAANGTPCGDFYFACQGAAGCYEGECQDPCDDGNPCTDGKCTADGCVYTGNAATCNDGNPCTENDSCADGLCGGEKTCDCSKDEECDYLNDGNPCTGQHGCKPNGTCGIIASTVVQCEDTGFEPCQANLCNSETGECDMVVAEDGFECDDAITCTDGDFCVEGICAGIGAITCEWQCGDGVDEDEDGLMDCEEPECWGLEDCAQPECGDDLCTALADEDCAVCPDDCGECAPECGDGKLQFDNDEECDDGNLDGDDGCDELCKLEPVAADPGALVITEIQKDPEAVLDAEGEWFEVYNTTDADIDINAWTLSDTGTDNHRIYMPGGVVVPTGAYFVLGVNGDADTNGGVTVGYDYSAFNLANADDEIILKSGETVVDVVAYDDGLTFPDAKGLAISLTLSKLTATDNDLGENWCDAETVYAGSDLGTPGAANPECPFCGDDECDSGENCGTCPADCDCGAGSECLDNNCIDLTPDGGGCGSNGDCVSGFCVDGVCCENACDGVCEGCAVSGNKGNCVPFTGDADPQNECPACEVCNGASACKFVSAGLDIKDDCTSQAEQSCGFDGTCDGAGICDYWDDQTICAAQKCNGNTLTPARTCDGEATCNAVDTSDCCPYKCGEVACLESCNENTDCCPGFTCTDNACVN
jgi:hypothetical protein